MIPLKTDKEIEIMREGGKKLAWVCQQVLKKIKPGLKLAELDSLTESLIKKQGGEPSFKMVKGYHWATCINLNQGVVHGIPDSTRIKAGDLVSLDLGMFYQGFHTDMARTVQVRTENLELETQNLKFLEAGEKALKAAIKEAKPGNRVGNISKAMEKIIREFGFRPVETLTGHGVGRQLHEQPPIPCFLKGKVNKTPCLIKGMTLAIEVIYVQGSPDLIMKTDNWTIETADGSLSGLIEDTIAVTDKNPLIITA